MVRYEISVPDQGRFSAVGEPGLEGTTRSVLVRPHRLKVELSSPDVHGLKGTIESHSYTGDSISYHVRVGTELFTAEMLTAGQSLLSVGDKATVSWRPEDALVLAEEVQ